MTPTNIIPDLHKESSADSYISISSENDEEDWIVACQCGVNYDDGEEMIACDECNQWQHNECMGFQKGEKLPERYICPKCQNQQEEVKGKDKVKMKSKTKTKTKNKNRNKKKKKKATRKRKSKGTKETEETTKGEKETKVPKGMESRKVYRFITGDDGDAKETGGPEKLSHIKTSTKVNDKAEMKSTNTNQMRNDEEISSENDQDQDRDNEQYLENDEHDDEISSGNESEEFQPYKNKRKQSINSNSTPRDRSNIKGYDSAHKRKSRKLNPTEVANDYIRGYNGSPNGNGFPGQSALLMEATTGISDNTISSASSMKSPKSPRISMSSNNHNRKQGKTVRERLSKKLNLKYNR